MVQMNIYKVILLDYLGKEIAEFGFYECKFDAEKRRAEVAAILTHPGILEIRTIDIIASSYKEPESEPEAEIYDLK